MTQKKKNNIIIGSLCAVVLLMAVGYAAFSSILNIKGTSSIGSNWDIAITAIDEKNIVGGATTATKENGDKKIEGIGTLTASFETNLVSPGDSIEYDITITNKGSLNAKLDKITLSEPNNEAIIFTTSGLEEGTTLPANNGTAVLTVKVEYSNAVTTQPDKTIGNLTVTLDYSQADGTSGTPGGETAADKLIATETTTGDGLYADDYESGRYIYKGTNPDNYITFNDETWRILSVENDGSLKIMKATSIGNIPFDPQGNRDSTSNGAGGTYCALGSYGCNAWSVSDNFVNGTKTGTVLKDASLNTYLNNDYYNSLSSEAQDLIQTHTWGVGSVTYENTDLAAQIASENGTTWSGNIGLMSASEYLRANTNTEQCGNYKLNNTNYNTCKTTNYIVPTSGYLWTVSPSASLTTDVLLVSGNGNVGYNIANSSYNGVLPVLYLTSDIHLDGEGTQSNPYRVVTE